MTERPLPAQTDMTVAAMNVRYWGQSRHRYFSSGSALSGTEPSEYQTKQHLKKSPRSDILI
jgi:hypothetical protein